MADVEPPPAKHPCVNGASKKKQKIGTHNGTFHCDEVMACYLLKQLPEYEGI